MLINSQFFQLDCLTQMGLSPEKENIFIILFNIIYIQTFVQKPKLFTASYFPFSETEKF